MAKQLNARIQTKHDTEQNWSQAAAFIPKAGEIIIYDATLDSDQLAAAKEQYETVGDESSRQYYESLLSKAVPRLKVGTGEAFLSKLPFISEPYVQKVDGKDLSDNNFDDDAKVIMDEAKAAKAKDILQFIDTKYKAGLGVNIVNDTTNPPSTASNYIYNSGVLEVKEASTNGYVDVVVGNGDGTSITKSIYIKGLNSAAFQSKESFVDSGLTTTINTAVQRIYVKDSSEEEEKKKLYYVDTQGNEASISLPLGSLAFMNSIDYSLISDYLATFTGASEEEPGTTGLVPMPGQGQQNFILTGDGTWRDYGQVILNIGNGLTYYNEQLYNTGLVAVYQEGTNLVFVSAEYGDDGKLTDSFTSFALGAGVSWSSTLTSGQQVGTLTIDGVKNVLYAPVASDRVAKSGDTMTGALTVNSTISATGNISTSANITASGTITGSQVYGAVWNDYAEYRAAESIEAGYCVYDTPSGTMKLTDVRLLPACRIISDTFGFAIGKNSLCQTPTAVSGRALVYTEDEVSIGDCLCSGKNGKLSKMTREEIKEYPDRIVGVVSEIPTYSTWGENNVPINGRIWVYVR